MGKVSCLYFYVVTILALGFSVVIHAQENTNDFEITHFQLPIETSTSHILEDRYGFIWIASTNGLWRFDGGNFKNYSKNENEQTSITDNHVSYLYEDSMGTLWIGTYGGGLLKYDREYDRFQRFIHDDNNPESLSFNEVRVIYETSDHSFYIGTDGGGLNLMDRETGTFKRYQHKAKDVSSISHNNVLDIEEDDDGRLFIGTWIGLNIFDSDTGSFTRLSQNTPNASHSYPLLEFYEELLISNTKLYTLDKVNRFHDLDFIFKNASHIEPDYEDNCWFVKNDEIIIVGRDFKVKKHISLNERFTDRSFFLSDIFHNPSKEDSWVLDHGGHFFHIKKSPKIFRHFVDNRGGSQILNTTTNYWVLRKGTVKIYSKKDLSFVNELTGFVNRTYMSSYGKEMVWVADTNTIKQFTQAGELVNIIPRKRAELFGLLETSEGLIWTGEVLGARIYNPKTGVTVYFDCDPNDPNGIGYFHRANELFEDYKNQIWLGTNGDGVKRYVPEKNIFVHYRHEIGNTATVNNNFINVIFEDADRTLWVGTNSGLCSYDVDKDAFIQYDNSLLKDRIINRIEQDAEGNLWLGTSNGLIKLDVKNDVVRILNEQDGLISQKIGISSLVTDEGHMVFGTNKGLMTFNPKEVVPSTKTPSVYISKLWVNNELVSPNSSYIKKSIEVEDHLQLSYKDQKIELGFQAIQYENAQRCQYAYKLEGFEEDWTIANGTRATYTNLPSGNYKFLLKVSNEDGIWTDKLKSISIGVTPPFWERSWVQILAALFVLSIAFWGFRFFLLRERTKNMFEIEKQRVYQFEELAQMKLRFFTNISHELRTPLTLITSPLDKFIRKGVRPDTKVLQMMHRNSNRLLELINQILDFRKLEGNQQLRIKPHDELLVCTNMSTAYEYWAKEKNINFTCETSETDCTLYFDEDIIKKIVSNLVSNAFKFTSRNGKISLKATYDILEIDKDEKVKKGNLLIEVIDNGLGIPKKYQKKVFERFYQMDETPNKGYSSGIGLSLTSELVKLHKGDIHLESEEGNGSHFMITLPIGYAIYETNIEETPAPSAESISGETVVLIIEDNEDIRNYLTSELSDDYVILQADNGKDGFHLALEHVPDIVISDIMMPMFDGIQVANQLKANELTAHIPLMFLTAKTGLENKLKGLETGAEDYIEKPFNVSEIKMKIQNRLESRHRLIKKYQKEELFEEPVITVDQYLIKVNEVIDNNLDNADFSIDFLCDELAIGRSQLYRKIQALTGKTIIEYINTYKLSKAMPMLQEGRLSIKEIAFSVGYNDNRYFSRIFKKEFGHPPSYYVPNK
ncbi:hybrid sensor histidine kinase/response regulator transcription factor [Zobellia uliginosa]|uniref:hybrid sensor histidine kinase/response regulator transcription factor n=1 Tax=Zobellia uliginosa TaxID=143224 RepID=UPI001C07684A|nr:hybrid sensor histidine kinase/response regulator transcription factor [Zobellia uliginosa]MBU2945908.1 response regulator [Zobellia uliginosa]